MSHYGNLLSNVVTRKLVYSRGYLEEIPFYVAVVHTVLVVTTYGSHEAAFSQYDWARATLEVVQSLHIASCAAFCVSYFVIIAPVESEDPREAGLPTVFLPDEEHLHEEELQLFKMNPGWPEPPEPPRSEWDRYCSWERLVEIFSLPLGWWSLILLAAAILAALPPGSISRDDRHSLFCTLGLLDYFRLPGGQMVVGSVRVGGQGLFNSFKMAVILITLWGAGSYLWWEKDINANNDCTSMLQCWYLAMDAGFRGDMKAMHSDEHDDLTEDGFPTTLEQTPMRHWQWWYLMVFFWAWDMMISGIIQGQIVDAFAEMRQASNDLADDNENKCIVCSLDRFTLEANVGSFDGHITDSHHPMSYLSFIVLLEEMRDDLETGTQSFVTDHLESSNSAWLPVRMCFDMQCKERRNGGEEDFERQQLEQVIQAVESLQSSQANMQRQLFNKLAEQERLLKHLAGGALPEAP